MAVKLRLETLPENLQAEALQEHPNFHSYGFEAKQAALKPFHRRNQQAESKRNNTVVKSIRKNQAARAVTEDLEKPAAIPTSKPAEKAKRIASPAQFNEDQNEDQVDLLPTSQIRSLLVGAGERLGSIAPSLHANRLMALAGRMEDHLDSYPVRGSDDTDTNNETANSSVEPTHVREVRKHLAKFYDALGKHNSFHSMAENPGESRSFGSDTYEVGGHALEGGGVEAGGTFSQEAGSRYGHSERRTTVDPLTAITHRPLAKEFLKMAAQHLGDAADAFKRHFPESDAHLYSPDYPVKDAATNIAAHYRESNLGEVTSGTKLASKQLMMTQEQRDTRTAKQKEKAKRNEGLHVSQLTDEAQADLFSKHPNFENYPETDEKAAVAGVNEDGTRNPSKDSILKEYQAAGHIKSTVKEKETKPELTHYQELLTRERTPEQAFGLLLGGMRNARGGRSVDKRISEVENVQAKATFAENAKTLEEAPAPDPNAKDKYGFTEQQHDDAFEAAHAHYHSNEPTGKGYRSSLAYTHPAKYMADVSASEGSSAPKRGGKGGSMAAFRGEA